MWIIVVQSKLPSPWKCKRDKGRDRNEKEMEKACVVALCFTYLLPKLKRRKTLVGACTTPKSIAKTTLYKKAYQIRKVTRDWAWLKVKLSVTFRNEESLNKRTLYKLMKQAINRNREIVAEWIGNRYPSISDIHNMQMSEGSTKRTSPKFDGSNLLIFNSQASQVVTDVHS